jgi:hypothetical protein
MRNRLSLLYCRLETRLFVLHIRDRLPACYKMVVCPSGKNTELFILQMKKCCLSWIRRRLFVLLLIDAGLQVRDRVVCCQKQDTSNAEEVG